MFNYIFNRRKGYDFMRQIRLFWGLGAFLLATSPLFAAADIPQDLLDTVRSNGTAEFFVVLEEQADVTHAYGLSSKAEKGKYVFESLTRTARETQAEIIKALEARNAKYESF